MPKNRNLLAKLDNERGRDVAAEKRKKQVKAAEKRKREKPQALGKEALDNGETQASTQEPTIPNGLEDKEGNDFAGFGSDDEDRSSDEDEEEEETEPTSADGAQSEVEDDEEEEEDSDIALSELSEEDRADTIPHQRLTINNSTALLTSTKRIRIARPGYKFSVHNSLVSSIPTNIPDPDDDLTRELEFYRVCSTAAKDARSLLKKENIAFTRPTDYFAEMVKSDEHMGKIKKKLYDDAARKKGASEARKQRDLKKFGKQVQVAKEQERAKERKQTLEKISSLKRKRKGMDTGNVKEDDDLFDVGVDDDGDDDRGKKRDQGNSNFKRQKRDQKFGFGGKKRFGKSGDAASSGDMSGFSVNRMKSKKGGTKRLGKSRRAGGAR